MSARTLVVTYPLTERSRAIVEDELSGAAEAIYLVDLLPPDRAAALGRATALLSHDTSQELHPDEIPLIPKRSVTAVYCRRHRLGADPRPAAGIADRRQ